MQTTGAVLPTVKQGDLTLQQITNISCIKERCYLIRLQKEFFNGVLLAIIIFSIAEFKVAPDVYSMVLGWPVTLIVLVGERESSLIRLALICAERAVNSYNKTQGFFSQEYLQWFTKKQITSPYPQSYCKQVKACKFISIVVC